MSSSNCCFLTCRQISQEADQVVWYSHLFQGTLKCLLQHHSSKASILQCSAFFTVQLSHPCRYAVTQVQVEEGKREKERAQESKRILLFQRNTPTSVPLQTLPYPMLGEGVGLGRLKEGRAHPELTVRGYWEIVHLFAKTAGTAVSERLAQQLGKKICPAGGHEGGSWRSKDRTWSGA